MHEIFIKGQEDQRLILEAKQRENQLFSWLWQISASLSLIFVNVKRRKNINSSQLSEGVYGLKEILYKNALY